MVKDKVLSVHSIRLKSCGSWQSVVYYSLSTTSLVHRSFVLECQCLEQRHCGSFRADEWENGRATAVCATKSVGNEAAQVRNDMPHAACYTRRGV